MASGVKKGTNMLHNIVTIIFRETVTLTLHVCDVILKKKINEGKQGVIGRRLNQKWNMHVWGEERERERVSY